VQSPRLLAVSTEGSDAAPARMNILHGCGSAPDKCRPSTQPLDGALCRFFLSPNEAGMVVFNRCNHLHFEEDDQFTGGSTAVFKLISSIYFVSRAARLAAASYFSNEPANLPTRHHREAVANRLNS
jgi:hypothetical protein